MVVKTMKKLSAIAALLLGATTLNANANDVELAIGEETFFLTLNTEATSIFQGGVFTFDGLFGEGDNRMLSAGLMVRDEGQGLRPVTFTLGGKLYNLGSNDVDDSQTALAIGGGARFHFPTAFPLSVGVSAFYAPNTTTFSDEITSMYDARIDISAHVLPQGFVFMGYRSISADFETDGRDFSSDIDDSFHLGLRLIF